VPGSCESSDDIRRRALSSWQTLGSGFGCNSPMIHQSPCVGAGELLMRQEDKGKTQSEVNSELVGKKPAMWKVKVSLELRDRDQITVLLASHTMYVPWPCGYVLTAIAYSFLERY